MQTTSGMSGVCGIGAGAAVGGGEGGVVGGGSVVVVGAGVVVVGWAVVDVGGGSVVATAVGTVDAATVVDAEVDLADRSVVAVGLVLQAASTPADKATTHKRDRSMLPELRMVFLRS